MARTPVHTPAGFWVPSCGGPPEQCPKQIDLTLPLDPRFMERIDQLASQRGLQGTDDYLAQWRWSEPQEREGTADEVARDVKRELEAAAGF